MVLPGREARIRSAYRRNRYGMRLCSEMRDCSAVEVVRIKTIEIFDQDAITDNGQETFNLLAERGIDNVIIMGVHLNMCVLGRPFAIRQLVTQGKNVLLIRDMTDTMYNSKMKPYVNHFAGTDLVVAHVERNWCPTILSTDFVGGKPFRFQEDNRVASE